MHQGGTLSLQEQTNEEQDNVKDHVNFENIMMVVMMNQSHVVMKIGSKYLGAQIL